MNPLPLVWPPLAPRLECAQAELLARARNGDREAIALLFGRSRERIVALCFQILRDRESAEDAAQEILLRAFDKMPQFRGESEFSTWLYRMALNFCLDRQRKTGRRAQLYERVSEPETFAPDHAGQIETRLALERALDELDEPSRLALILREWHELSYEEIAAVLRLPLGTVKSRLNSARREFRRVWEAQNGE